jgi:hypothetical protein
MGKSMSKQNKSSTTIEEKKELVHLIGKWVVTLGLVAAGIYFGINGKPDYAGGCGFGVFAVWAFID